MVISRVFCINGAFVPADKATVFSFDQGFLYGYGLFETILIKEGKPVFLGRHIERLNSSAKAIDIPLPVSPDELAWLIQETINRNGIGDGSLRLTLTAGPVEEVWNELGEEQGHLPGNYQEREKKLNTTLVIFTRQLPYTEAHYRNGLTAGFSSIRRNENSPLVRLKTLNYLDNLLARKEARARGWDEALFLNNAGNLAEGSLSNVFLLTDGKVITPSVDQGLLPGIVREVVLEKCLSLGIPVQEKVVSVKELRGARECFLTNSLMGVMPLVSIEGYPVGNGRPGAVTLQLGREVLL